MDSIIKWALSQALGSVRGAVVYNIYGSLKGSSTNTTQTVLLAVVQWALGQLLGTEKGAEAFVVVQGFLPK